MNEKKMYPFKKENEYDNSICARCGSRDKLGRIIATRDSFTFGDKGRGLCDKCLKEVQRLSMENALNGGFKIPVEEAEENASGQFDREVSIVRTKESRGKK